MFQLKLISAISHFPVLFFVFQLMGHSEWDHKRGSRGSQVSYSVFCVWFWLFVSLRYSSKFFSWDCEVVHFINICKVKSMEKSIKLWQLSLI